MASCSFAFDWPAGWLAGFLPDFANPAWAKYQK
jgi:hypothetical protein